MTKAFDYVKHQVGYFKVDTCCWVAPVKAGLLIFAYFNLILATVILISLSEENKWPLLMQVSIALMPDKARRPIPMLAYATELAFTIVLLCAFYRKDIQLMRVYQFYCLAAVVLTFMVYSMVVATVGTTIGILMVMAIILQLYIILLVRSVTVLFKLEKKNLELPTLVLSTISEPKEVKVNLDVETSPVADENERGKTKGDTKVDKKEEKKLKTVDEHSKEESSSDSEEIKEKK